VRDNRPKNLKDKQIKRRDIRKMENKRIKNKQKGVKLGQREYSLVNIDVSWTGENITRGGGGLENMIFVSKYV
jgi:hypothetical protein